jgi:hypothetical protein
MVARSATLGIASCLLVGLIPASAHAAHCERDADCKGDRVCEEGKCVESPQREERRSDAGGNKKVEIRFEAAGEADVFAIEVDGQQCTTPCALSVAEGSRTISVSGPATFERSVVVPSQGDTYQIHRGNRTALVLGIVGVAVGGSALGAGAYFAFIETKKEQYCNEITPGNAPCYTHEKHPNKELGAALLVGGGLLTAGGIVSFFFAGKYAVEPKQSPAATTFVPAIAAAPLTGGGFLSGQWVF